MDRLTVEVTVEQTEILRPQVLIVTPRAPTKAWFTVLCEEMDRVNEFVVHEGVLNLSSLVRVDEVDEVQLEGFPDSAQAYAREHGLHKITLMGAIGIGKTHSNSHRFSGRAEAARATVSNYPQNQQRLVVATLAEHWQVGLLAATLRCLQAQP